MDKHLVAAGTTQIAAGALSGWGLAALVGVPGLAERIGVVDTSAVRRAHLDVIIMGGLVTAAGLVDGVPTWARRAVTVGAWTNPLLFLPLAVRPDAPASPVYKAASLTSFTVTCAGWIGVAAAARRGRRAVAAGS
jgi:hypothetical protein